MSEVVRDAVRTESHTVNGPHGAIPVRVYRSDAPDGTASDGALSGCALVWVHGGGFAAGTLDWPEADWVSRSIAERGATVVSVDYRLADENVHYPVPSDDVLAAFEWAHGRAGALGCEPGRIALGGASAGANLAAGVALRMRRNAASAQQAEDNTAVEPRALFLAYPTVHAVQPPTPPELQSLLSQLPNPEQFGPVAVRSMYERYLGAPAETADSVAVPGLATADELRGLPPALFINSERDELRVSGEAFATALASAGVPVESHTEAGTTHGHLNQPAHPAAAASIERVVDWMARTLAR